MLRSTSKGRVHLTQMLTVELKRWKTLPNRNCFCRGVNRAGQCVSRGCPSWLLTSNSSITVGRMSEEMTGVEMFLFP